MASELMNIQTALCDVEMSMLPVRLSVSGVGDVRAISSSGSLFVHIRVTSLWACQQSGVRFRTPSRVRRHTCCQLSGLYRRETYIMAIGFAGHSSHKIWTKAQCYCE